MSLQTSIQAALGQKKILLMTHLVLGYPSLEENLKVIAEMDQAGVELVELQIPFSEPSADGPVIVKANSQALAGGIKVQDCLDFAAQVTKRFSRIQFLFMTYYNIVFARGEERFLREAKAAGIKGFIIPDLPPEEGQSWMQSCQEAGLDNVLIFAPTNRPERLKQLGQASQGLVYCVGRRGVTGSKTDFSQEMAAQIGRYRQATQLPLALGFGVQSREDVEFLTSKVDIAVIGSKLIRIHQEEGAKGVGRFLSGLR